MNRFKQFKPYLARKFEFQYLLNNPDCFHQNMYEGIEQFLVITKTSEIHYIPKQSNQFMDISYIDVILDVVYIPQAKITVIYDLLYYKNNDIATCEPYFKRIELCYPIHKFIQSRILEEVLFNEQHSREELNKYFLGTCIRHKDFIYSREGPCFGNILLPHKVNLSVYCREDNIYTKNYVKFQVFLAHIWMKKELIRENSDEDVEDYFDNFCEYHLQLPLVYNETVYDDYFEMIKHCPELLNQNIYWICSTNSDEYFKIESVESSGNFELDSHDVALHKYLQAQYFDEPPELQSYEYKNIEPTGANFFELQYQFPNPQQKYIPLFDMKQFKQLSKQLNSNSYFAYINNIKRIMLVQYIGMFLKELPMISIPNQKKRYVRNSFVYETKTTKISEYSTRYKIKVNEPYLNYRIQMFSIHRKMDGLFIQKNHILASSSIDTIQLLLSKIPKF